MRTLIRSALVVGFIALVVAARSARADGPEVYMQVKIPDPKDPKEKGMAPWIEATIVNGSQVLPEKLTLSTTYQSQKLTMRAEKTRNYIEGTETIAIALVINGQEIWVGNEDVEQDENAKY